MRILTPGHTYELDVVGDKSASQELVFRNTETIPTQPGITSQEVLRALIARSKHVNKQKPHPANDFILYHLRMALVLHESRALERKTHTGKLAPEMVLVNKDDGHFVLDDVDDG